MVKVVCDNELDLVKKIEGGFFNDLVGFIVFFLIDLVGVKFGKSVGNVVWFDKF